MGTRKHAARLRQKTLEHLHAALIERERRLLEKDESRAGAGKTDSRYESADDLEMAADLSDREILYRIAEHHGEELSGIGEAFRKMKEGNYGICEECAEPIPAARLRALPHARLCVRCQRESERYAETEDDAAHWKKLGGMHGGESSGESQSIRLSSRH